MNEGQQWMPLAERVIENGLYGIAACSVLFIVGLLREWVVLGTHYRVVVKDRDEYKALTRTSEESAKKILDILASMSSREGRK